MDFLFFFYNNAVDSIWHYVSHMVNSKEIIHIHIYMCQVCITNASTRTNFSVKYVRHKTAVQLYFFTEQH